MIHYNLTTVATVERYTSTLHYLLRFTNLNVTDMGALSETLVLDFYVLIILMDKFIITPCPMTTKKKTANTTLRDREVQHREFLRRDLRSQDSIGFDVDLNTDRRGGGSHNNVSGVLKINLSSRTTNVWFYANDSKSIEDALYMFDKLEYSVLEFTRNARSMLTDLQTELRRREG